MISDGVKDGRRRAADCEASKAVGPGLSRLVKVRLTQWRQTSTVYTVHAVTLPAHLATPYLRRRRGIRTTRSAGVRAHAATATASAPMLVIGSFGRPSSRRHLDIHNVDIA